MYNIHIHRGTNRVQAIPLLSLPNSRHCNTSMTCDNKLHLPAKGLRMPLLFDIENSYSVGLELTRTKLLIKARFTCLQTHTYTHTHTHTHTRPLLGVCEQDPSSPQPHNWVLIKLELIPGTTLGNVF